MWRRDDGVGAIKWSGNESFVSDFLTKLKGKHLISILRILSFLNYHQRFEKALYWKSLVDLFLSNQIKIILIDYDFVRNFCWPLINFKNNLLLFVSFYGLTLTSL